MVQKITLIPKTNPLPLDQAMPNRVQFPKMNTQQRFAKLLSIVSIAGGATLAASSIPYTISNIVKGDPNGTGPATTLLTHVAGLEKHDDNLGGAYHGDPNDYIVSKVTRDGKDIDSTIDAFLGGPGNFSIFLGGILLMGLGVGVLSEKASKDLRTKIKEALQRGETLTFMKGNQSMQLRIINTPQDKGVETVINGKKHTRLYSSISDIDTLISIIVSKFDSGHRLEDLHPY